MGATRDLALTELPIRGLSINPASGGSSAITVVPSDSGIMFINKFGTETEYTLPLVAEGKGKMFWFYNAQSSTAVLVSAQTAILMGVNSATGTTLTDGSNIGDCCLVVGDGTNYFGFVLSGSWTTGA